MKKLFFSLLFCFCALVSWAFWLDDHEYTAEDDLAAHLYPDNYVGFCSFDIGSKTEVLGGVSTLGSGLYIEMGFNPFVWAAPLFRDYVSSDFFENYRYQFKAGIKIGFNLM